MRGPSRRAVLAGAAAALAAPWVARAAAPEALAAIFGRSGLAGVTGFALLDLDSGRLVEAHRAEAAQPPASVAKVVTALYALEALGADYRFPTRVLARGPVQGGVLAGDLVLAGGGDPVLDTDGLGELAAALSVGGLRRVTGRMLVAVGALPAAGRIEVGQPTEAAYDPAVSGTNLNFNRVFLSWAPRGDGPALAFAAPGARYSVPVAGIVAELDQGGVPEHRMAEGREIWRLPRASVHGRGSVWLPVRKPGVYAGEVFGRLASGAGIAGLPAAEVVPAVSGGGVMAERASPALGRMLRDMLRYSTNLTAEVVGLRASQARGEAPATLAASAAAMTDWARGRLGLGRARLVNHSGLSVRSAVTARELADALARARDTLPGLLPERPILDAAGRPVEIGGARVVSKTGTMDFVSALAGYVTGPRRLAFAILVADPGLRAEIPPEARDRPPGGAAWLRRARAQEQALLRRWAALDV